MKKTFFLLVFTFLGTRFFLSQDNTAVLSGPIGKCAVWDYPYTQANTVSGSQTINNGVTVTVDQNRNIGAVNLSGTGALDLSGVNGITMSGAGAQINCRWDASVQSGTYTIVNNDGINTTDTVRPTGIFFTAPYNGNYIWKRGAGWNSSYNTSTLYNAAINIRISGTSAYGGIFYQNQPGTCPIRSGTTNTSAFWRDTITLNAAPAGQSYLFEMGTGYSSNPACQISFTATIGQSQILYDN